MTPVLSFIGISFETIGFIVTTVVAGIGIALYFMLREK